MAKIIGFEKWNSRKLFVLHMETPLHDVENKLGLKNIPFDERTCEEKDLDEVWNSIKDEYCGVIISGSRKWQEELPPVPLNILSTDKPLLGICYGNEMLGLHLGSKIIDCEKPGEHSEVIGKLFPSVLFKGMDLEVDHILTMAHDYMLDSVPNGCKIIAQTNMTPIAGFECLSRRKWGIQFHPEKNLQIT